MAKVSKSGAIIFLTRPTGRTTLVPFGDDMIGQGNEQGISHDTHTAGFRQQLETRGGA